MSSLEQIDKRADGTPHSRVRPRIRVAERAEEYPAEKYEGEGDWDAQANGGQLGQIFFRSMLILLAVTLLLMLFVLLNTRVRFDTLINAFSVRFLSLFIEAAPFLLLGTLVSGLIEAFVRREHITRWVPRNPVGGVLMGTVMGFAFPVCECGVVPVVRQLYTKSLPLSVGVAFLLAAPVMNPIVLLSTLTAFGFGPVLAGRFAITAVVAVGVGLFFALGARRFNLQGLPSVVDASAGSLTSGVQAPQPPAPVPARIRQALVTAGDEAFEMGRYLIVGCLLASALQTLVSQDVLLSLGQGPVTSVLTMQVLAFVLSVCSTVDAFIALAFAGTFTTGSILAFLTFGPMVDVKSTIMFLGVFSKRTVALLILLPLLLTMIIAIWLNLSGIG